MRTGEFHVVPGAAIAEILSISHVEVLRLVERTYALHEYGQTVNPDSYFLRFPDKPGSRVIALPAYVGGDIDMIGIKWISSFPRNIAAGLPRASAVLVLNDYETGYPIACLEAAAISAARTAASACIAAHALTTRTRPQSVGFIGTGVIAAAIADYIVAAKVAVSRAICFDLDPVRGERFATRMTTAMAAPVTLASTAQDVLRCDLVVLATTAASPHVGPDTPLSPGQVLLHISLRDLAPELLLSANNVVDDVEHCLKAETSPHLAERLSGSRDFVNGTLGGVLRGDVRLDPMKATVFSPFGLGVLDICIGAYVLAQARRRGTAISIPGFFDSGETLDIGQRTGGGNSP